MPRSRASVGGFARLELGAALVVVVTIAAVLAIMADRSKNTSYLSVSLSNTRQINAAILQYRMDAHDRIPMRCVGYSQGSVQVGWDTWNFGGKNTSAFWISGFDELARWRPLNFYLYDDQNFPDPTGWHSSGSGATWTFIQGSVPLKARVSLELPVFRSPGDTTSRERTWTVPTPGLSSYDDVGTSYHLNMKMWELPRLPLSFAARYHWISERLRKLDGADPNNDYVWMFDEVGNVVGSSEVRMKGQFGGINRSVVGYMNGAAAYIPIVINAFTGPGYSLAIP